MRNCHHRNTDEPKPYYLLFIKKKKILERNYLGSGRGPHLSIYKKVNPGRIGQRRSGRWRGGRRR